MEDFLVSPTRGNASEVEIEPATAVALLAANRDPVRRKGRDR